VVSGVEKKKKQGDQEVRLGTVLWWKEIKAPSEDSMGDFPYRESHRRKIPGRWLGIGKVEELLDPQIRMNELQNIKSKGLHLSALQVFQSRDMTVARNLLEDTLNGEILRVDSEITPLQVKDVNLSHFQQEEQRWDKNIQERSFTFESETGESLPSGTPFRLGALLAAKSGGFFDLMREDIGLFLSDIFYEVMIPLFKADRKKKHSLVLPVDEKGMMDRIKEFTEWILQSELEGGNIPRDIDERRRIIIEKIVKAGFLAIEIPESRYDDVEAKIKLVITDEQIDLNQKLESISSFVQLIASNPAILQVEPLKNLVFGAMQMAGINPADYGLNVPIQPMQAPVEQQSGQELPVPGNVTTQTTQ
jgi:hypothetical protein